MMKHIVKVSLCLFVLLSALKTDAQVFDPIKGCVVDANGECISNTVITAMPFLRIAPDARAGAMGDVGIATSPTSNSIHHNASNLAFSNDQNGLSLTYTPWLQDLNLDDVYLLYLSGFYKIDELQTIGASFRYFSLGDIQFRDNQGGELGIGMPREAEAAITYSRKLGDNFSAALTGKYIYSNLATGQSVGPLGSQNVQTASSFAADVSLTYKKPMKLGDYNAEMTYGLAMSNIGSKVSYLQDSEFKDFIPTNLGLGAALKLDLDQYNQMTFSIELNKLMIPSPVSSKILNEDGTESVNPKWDEDGDGIADYRQKALFAGMFGSFGDAQGGFKEELKELNISAGIEYWYNNQVALRAGYFYEHPEKGDRKFLTVGLGLKYNIFGFDLSYLVPTNNRRTPLDNTLRFGLSFDLEGSRQATP